MCSETHRSPDLSRDRSRSPRRDRSVSPRRDRYRSPRRDRSVSPRRDRSRHGSVSPCRDSSRIPRWYRKRKISPSPASCGLHCVDNKDNTTSFNVKSNNSSVRKWRQKKRKVLPEVQKLLQEEDFPDAPVEYTFGQILPLEKKCEYKGSQYSDWKAVKDITKLEAPEVLSAFLNSSAESRNMLIGVLHNGKVSGVQLTLKQMDEYPHILRQNMQSKVNPFRGVLWSVEFQRVQEPNTLTNTLQQKKQGLFVIRISVVGTDPKDESLAFKVRKNGRNVVLERGQGENIEKIF